MDGRPLLYRPEEAARLLGIGRTTLFRLIRTGELRSVKVGGQLRRIPADALVDFVNKLSADKEAA